ncbi:hypothetical protein [Aeromicrobium ginsengisoli]|uniref:Uncharacterized protein n=1 Tax=Aeromicrobium ginsengisoli TaxID=363867 RepID=A0A5M4FFF1_9ACTN|nr:hypothetical protein [Aeromicrobium ginsengisoli]KAA1397846.1 hypothetical protein ESP70_010915 [Aeromicrobium ginsengisoli]
MRLPKSRGGRFLSAIGLLLAVVHIFRMIDALADDRSPVNAALGLVVGICIVAQGYLVRHEPIASNPPNNGNDLG